MNEIEDLVARVEQLESRLLMTDLRQQDGESSAGKAQSAEFMDQCSSAETDHEVFWDDELEQWAVRWSAGAFSYAGMSSQPDSWDGEKVPVGEGESASIYGHALMSVDEHGKVTKVESLTYDTNSVGASAEEDQVAFDFLVATIKDDVVYQNVIGAVHVGSNVVRDGKLTLKDEAGNTLGEFTANQDDEEPVEVTIPSGAKNGKLTILDSEGNTLGEFTANQDDEEPVEVTIPAQEQVNADWLATEGPAEIMNKPTIPQPLTGTIEYIPKDGIRYDVSTHQIQVKFNTLDLSTGQHTIGTTWTMITGGQAVPHSTV